MDTEESNNIQNRAGKHKPGWFNLLLKEGPDERDCPEGRRSVWMYDPKTALALLGNSSRRWKSEPEQQCLLKRIVNEK